jgi:ribose transport system substrate-binding protein
MSPRDEEREVRINPFRRGRLTGGLAMLVTGLAIAGCGSSSSSSSGSEASASNAANTASSASSGARGTAGASETSSGSTVTVTTGPYKITLPKGNGHLKIAFFENASENTWQINFGKAAVSEAHKYGDSITVFNGDFDVTTQIGQMINVAQSHKYNTAILSNIDTNAECNVATKTLPAAGILVAVAAQPICGHGTATTGIGLWQPGTLNYVGGDVSLPAVAAWANLTGKLNPGAQNVAVVVGPSTAAVTASEEGAINAYAKAHPSFHVATYINTDYTTPTTYTAVLNYLHAHPNTTLIMSVYSPDCTRGVIQALAALGKVGKIKVADEGGASYALHEIKAGALELTMPYFPEVQARDAVDSLVQAANGQGTPPFVSDVPSQYGTWTQPLAITKQNSSSFTPEY